MAGKGQQSRAVLNYRGQEAEGNGTSKGPWPGTVPEGTPRRDPHLPGASQVQSSYNPDQPITLSGFVNSPFITLASINCLQIMSDYQFPS